MSSIKSTEDGVREAIKNFTQDLNIPGDAVRFKNAFHSNARYTIAASERTEAFPVAIIAKGQHQRQKKNPVRAIEMIVASIQQKRDGSHTVQRICSSSMRIHITTESGRVER